VKDDLNVGIFSQHSIKNDSADEIEKCELCSRWFVSSLVAEMNYWENASQVMLCLNCTRKFLDNKKMNFCYIVL
jgi:hypothetical protein